MSKPTDRGSSSSSSNNNNTVAPHFFGSPSLYQSTPTKKKGNDESLGASAPKAENPYWNDMNNPPPPYSPAPNEPISPHSSFSADPSAPPLESPTDYSQNSGYSHPQQLPQPSQQYPPFGYHHYGAVPRQYPPNNNTTSDANMPSWPWIAPPSTTGQPLLVYQPSPPPPGEYEAYSAPPTKKQKSCCEISVQYFFYFFCICLVLRLIDLLSGGVNFAGSCSHGVVWEALPKQIEYDAGIIIRVVGGQLSGGHIVIKNIDEKTAAENGIVKGTIQSTALISPASLAHNSDLSFTLTQLMNGTIMEIYIPQDLSSRSCVSLNTIIYVPQNTDYVSIDVQNARIEVSDERLDAREIALATTNEAIEFNPNWEGTNLVLSTTNAHIEVNNPIVSSKVVMVTTTNGGIRARHPIKATEEIYFSTSNAGVDVDDTVECGNAIVLSTTNGHINARNITARAAQVKSTNGRIQVDHANMIDLFNVQTTNSRLSLRLDSGNKAEVIARTSNSGISTYLPQDFEGRFEVDTSSHSNIALVDPLGWAHIESVGKGHVAGTRLAPESNRSDRKPMGHLQVFTSNANAQVHFG